ncbi:lysostaphin resistance A-like protein [Brevibacillus fluminis]|uniref:CPBP family intramembrane glutamic endopeptidase n=1 Tax=Brevibacillus fluminis TaxID=511487 RepID=UPI003F8C198F
MQVRLGLQPELHPRKERAVTWAVWMLGAYLLQFVVEWAFIRFTKDEHGQWMAYTVETPEGWLNAALIISLLFGLVCAVGFVWRFFRRERLHSALWQGQGLTGTDFLYTLAWLQVLLVAQYVVYGFFVAFPIFPEGSVGGLLESASFQLSILLIAVFQYWGRWADLGFRKPKNIGRLVVMLILLMGFILFVLDMLITTPLSQFFDLSLVSERQDQIESEIMQAKSYDWVHGVMSILMTGVLVPIAEEILFRGVIQTSLVKRWGAFWGIAISSVWFASVHIDIALFVPLFTISLAIGYLRHRFNSIWGAIILHSLNNLVSVIFYFN